LSVQPAGVGIECWQLGSQGTFERYQPPLDANDSWPHTSMRRRRARSKISGPSSRWN